MMMMNRTKSAVVKFRLNKGICITRSFSETGLASPIDDQKKCVVVEDRIDEACMFLNKHNTSNKQLCEPTTTIKALLCDNSDKTMNIATYNLLIDAHCVKGEINKARSLVDSMPHHLSPDNATYTSLLNRYCNQYNNNRLDPDVQAHDKNVMMDDGMMLIYHEMKIKGFKPDCVTYNRMIERCFQSAGLVDEARQLLDDLLAQGHTLDTCTYCDILTDLFGKRDVEEALSLFHFFDEQDSNLNSDPLVLKSLVGGLVSCEEFDYARELFEGPSARGVKPTPETYNVMLFSLFQQGLINDAKLFLETEENDCWPNTDTYNYLLQHYLDCKCYDDVKVLLCKMKRQKHYYLSNYVFSLLRASVADGSLDASWSDLINKLRDRNYWASD